MQSLDGVDGAVQDVDHVVAHHSDLVSPICDHLKLMSPSYRHVGLHPQLTLHIDIRIILICRLLAVVAGIRNFYNIPAHPTHCVSFDVYIYSVCFNIRVGIF